MAVAVFPKGAEGLIDGTIDLDTDTIKVALLDLGTTDTGIKAVTGATNATPIVITSTSHGFANGDLVLIGGVGGNLAANGVFKVANQAANTFELTYLSNPVLGTYTNVSGSGAYTSGGYAVCLGPSAAGDNWDDFSAAVVGTPYTLAAKTVTSGVFDNSADATFASIPNTTIEAWAVYEDTGVESTSRMLLINDGRQTVRCVATAAASATSIAVEPLPGGIPNSTTIVFSNGASATLSALASAGDRTLTVTSLAAQVVAGAVADAPVTNSNLPLTPGTGSPTVTVQFDNNARRILSLGAI